MIMPLARTPRLSVNSSSRASSSRIELPAASNLKRKDLNRPLGCAVDIISRRVVCLDNSPRFVMIAESAVTFLPDRKFVL